MPVGADADMHRHAAGLGHAVEQVDHDLPRQLRCRAVEILDEGPAQGSRGLLTIGRAAIAQMKPLPFVYQQTKLEGVFLGLTNPFGAGGEALGAWVLAGGDGTGEAAGGVARLLKRYCAPSGDLLAARLAGKTIPPRIVERPRAGRDAQPQARDGSIRYPGLASALREAGCGNDGFCWALGHGQTGFTDIRRGLVSASLADSLRTQREAIRGTPG